MNQGAFRRRREPEREPHSANEPEFSCYWGGIAGYRARPSSYFAGLHRNCFSVARQSQSAIAWSGGCVACSRHGCYHSRQQLAMRWACLDWRRGYPAGFVAGSSFMFVWKIASQSCPSFFQTDPELYVPEASLPSKVPSTFTV